MRDKGPKKRKEKKGKSRQEVKRKRTRQRQLCHSRLRNAFFRSLPRRPPTSNFTSSLFTPSSPDLSFRRRTAPKTSSRVSYRPSNHSPRKTAPLFCAPLAILPPPLSTPTRFAHVPAAGNGPGRLFPIKPFLCPTAFPGRDINRLALVPAFITFGSCLGSAVACSHVLQATTGS